MAAPDPHEALQEPPPGQEEPDLKAALSGSLAALRYYLADLLGLAALEAQLAGLSLAAVFALALGLAFLLMAAWILLQAAAVVALGRADVPVDLTLLILAVANVGLGVLCLRWIRRSLQNMRFRALRAALKGREADAAAEASH